MTERVFHPVTKRIPIPKGGRIDSHDLSQFVEGVASDLRNIALFEAYLRQRLQEISLVTKLEGEDLRQRILQLESQLLAERKVASVGGSDSVWSLSLFDSSHAQHLAASALARRATLDTTFGIATLPLNAVEHRFQVENLRTGTLTPIANLQIDVTGTFDASDGNGVTNHELGATIVAGDPSQAFNGNDTKRWIRRLEYGLEDDTTEVMTEITVTIPSQGTTKANVVYIHPFPEGDLDIVGVYASPDLSDSFVMIPSFTEIRGAGPSKWIFVAQDVQRLKVRLRQRNWVEEEGKKVFYVGAQEIALQLAEFDKTYSGASPVEDNNSFVLEAEAPEDFLFNTLKKVYTDPLFTLETAGQRHVHLKLCRVGDGSDVVWDSDVDALPQAGAGVSFTPCATLYWIVTLNWVASTGGVSSPYPVGTPPYVKSLSFEASTEAE